MRSLPVRVQTILRAFGWRGVARRCHYVAVSTLGVLRRRLPERAAFDAVPRSSWSHRYDVAGLRARYASLPDRDAIAARVQQRAAQVLDGELTLYGGTTKRVGWPPDWHANAFSGHRYPRRHFTAISDADAEVGDIKDVWELSRLPFTFVFARAYVLTEDERYPQAWWQAIESWAADNPPNVGVNWRCAQEVSLRGIAVCFGLSVFGDHPSTSAPRLELAERILGASVERVRPTIGYALSQRNNHAISELAFLIGVDGPDRRWCRLLLEAIDDQFYADGSYSQQSFNYQRLAVQTLQWLLCVRDDLPPGLRRRIVETLAASRDLLARCSDPVSGFLPNYGPNDSALLLPISEADPRDVRPLLASLGATSAAGCTDEATVWMQHPELASIPSEVKDRPTTYHTLRGPRSLLLTRLGTGRHRPGHGDQQAVDIWIDGHNVVVDPGTYRYTAPSPWRNALTGPQVHSGPRAPDEHGTTIGRFLSLGMPPAQVETHVCRDGLEVLVSRRPAGSGWLWRAIVRDGDAFVVVDAAQDTDAVVRWNLDLAAELSVYLAPAARLSRRTAHDSDPTSGWSSPRYAHKRRIDAWELRVPDGEVAVARIARDRDQLTPRHLLDAALTDLLPSAVQDTLALTPWPWDAGRDGGAIRLTGGLGDQPDRTPDRTPAMLQRSAHAPAPSRARSRQP